MPARPPLARLLRLAPYAALLQGCASIFGGKSTDVAPVSEPPAAEAQRDTATATQPPVQPFQPSAPNEIVSERIKTERRRAVGDMVRTKLVTIVEQGRPGILRVGLGENFHSHQARQYYFTQLAVAYNTWRLESNPLIIELWEHGKKIGEYTDRGFLIGPEHTMALDCPDTAATGLCNSAADSLQRTAPPAIARDETAAPLRARAGSSGNVRERTGFHFGAGLGGGSMDFACRGCDFGSESGFSGFISLAGAVGEKTLVGIEGTGWTKSESGTTARVYSVTAAVTEYLNARSGLFLSAGMGVVGYDANTDFGDRTANAVGFSGRVGYEIGRGGVAIVPYLGIARTFGGADMKLNGQDAGLNVAISNVYFGLGIAVR